MSKRSYAIVALLIVVGCGGCGSSASTESETAELTGSWVARDASNVAASYGFTFSLDGGYTRTTMVVAATDQVASPGSANLAQESGVFTVSSADSISFAPTQSTCPGPIPVYALSYGFSGRVLVMGGVTGASSFSPDPMPATATPATTYGCYDSTGAFTAHPLAPVTN